MTTKRWTAQVRFEWCDELIDIEAASLREAKEKLQEVLAEDYMPGGKLVAIEREQPEFTSWSLP